MENQDEQSFNEFYREVADDISDETRFWSGNMQHAFGYPILRGFGELALRPLLEDVQSPAHQTRWWQLQMIWEIAADTGQPVPFTPDIAGKYSEVCATTLAWGYTQGYIVPPEPMERP